MKFKKIIFLYETPTIFVVENGIMTEIDRLQFLKIASKLAE